MLYIALGLKESALVRVFILGEINGIFKFYKWRFCVCDWHFTVYVHSDLFNIFVLKKKIQIVEN